MKKKSVYGLQLRVAASKQKKKKQGPTRPPLPTTALGFGDADDDDDDVEKEISRHASKNKALKHIEEQHKKALEEDPSVFDYDGVYDDIKVKAIQPRAQDREERMPKYILMLRKKAKQRKWEQEIVYERKIAKEMSKDDHLYADKDKFVTVPYKRKLQEKDKGLEKDRLCELREERDDVTKKTDISDFYFNLTKNVAFGGKEGKSKKSEKHHKQVAVQTEERPSSSADAHPQISRKIKRKDHEASVSPPRKERTEQVDKPHQDGLSEEKVVEGASDNGPTAVTESVVSDQPKVDHHKRNQDAVATAKERFLARKRVKEQ